MIFFKKIQPLGICFISGRYLNRISGTICADLTNGLVEKLILNPEGRSAKPSNISLNTDTESIPTDKSGPMMLESHQVLKEKPWNDESI